VPNVPPNVTPDFWHFDLASVARLDINYTAIYYSWAKRKLPGPSAPSGTWWVKAWPYVEIDLSLYPSCPSAYTFELDVSCYNVNWFVFNDFFYAFTEDSNYNGKIDRLRMQSAFEVINQTEDAFNNFEVSVEGYEIDRSRGHNGYARADFNETTQTHTSDPDKLDCIYVYLVEKSYTDSGAVPAWQVARNTTLQDSTKTTLIGEPGNKGRPGRLPGDNDFRLTIDTVPPRINYALTLPGLVGAGGHQVYFQFSEPIDRTMIDTYPSSGKTSSGLDTLPSAVPTD
jgi:hypothetical protein